MCEQCSAATVTYGTVVPGVILARATAKGLSMEPGDWGLIRCNDPDVIFRGEFVKDPGDGEDDDSAFWEAFFRFRDAFRVSPTIGWEIGEAAKSVGWDRKEEWLETFLYDRCVELAEKGPVTVETTPSTNRDAPTSP